MAFQASAIIRETFQGSSPTPGLPPPPPIAVATLPPELGLRELAFDGLMSVGHDTSLSLTSYPTEAGSDLIDHTYENPNTIRMVGGVSLLSQTTPLTAWALIQQLRLSRRLVTISTNIGSYTNMILTKAQTLEDQNTQGAILVTLEFRELLVAGSTGGFTVTPTGPAANRFSTQINRGFVEAQSIDFGAADLGFEI